MSNPSLPIDPSSDKPTAEVPSFGCIVYVKRDVNGGVVARVANLDGISVVASTERDALAKIVPEFKQRVRDGLASGQPIAWIDPPLPMESDEQKRFLPTHL
ncbi:hypothetical protein Poly51_05380 [Rubripirellula tenax]|uniref:Uncharacterized protein n=1 Tax=Rubripirellula tenax TaxID=2528015 RepID=A0A5C6FI58_9BACT|nr:hypothetical protein [Rubripirellula tenax]TWU60263.1 hypothetical protein Poly51_05380 [Rubripirellula tenax]